MSPRPKRKPTGDELEPVWRALSDPTRREILDLLRERPMTTGELAERFDMSRYGVMCHLDVLEEANLLVVRREGRFRWNHINPVPIQEIYRRWIRPFEARGADMLLRLKESVEKGGKGRRKRSTT